MFNSLVVYTGAGATSVKMWKYLLMLALVQNADNITVIEVDTSDLYHNNLPQETPNDRPIIGEHL